MLSLFICTGERLPSQLVRSASKVTSKGSSVVAPGKCYKPENKRKCTEPEWKSMSDDLMDLNDTELNYIYFEMALVTSRVKTLCYKKAYFILNSLA